MRRGLKNLFSGLVISGLVSCNSNKPDVYMYDIDDGYIEGYASYTDYQSGDEDAFRIFVTGLDDKKEHFLDIGIEYKGHFNKIAVDSAVARFKHSPYHIPTRQDLETAP